MEQFPYRQVVGKLMYLAVCTRRVRHMRFQEADMEHRMDVHGSGQGQAIGRSTNLANDNVGAKSTNIQFG